MFRQVSNHKLIEGKKEKKNGYIQSIVSDRLGYKHFLLTNNRQLKKIKKNYAVFFFYYVTY